MRSLRLGPPGAHATRRWSPCSGSHLPPRTGTRPPLREAILPWPSGPSERRLPNASARDRARTSHRTLGMSTINSDEHDAKHGVRSGPGQQARNELASAGVRTASQQYAGKKQGRVWKRSGMEESEASRSTAETNSLDRSSCRQRTTVICKASACLLPNFRMLPTPSPCPHLHTASSPPELVKPFFSSVSDNTRYFSFNP